MMNKTWQIVTDKLANKGVQFCSELIGAEVIDEEVLFEEEFFRVVRTTQIFDGKDEVHFEVGWYIVGDCVPMCLTSPEIGCYADAVSVYFLQLYAWALAAAAKRLEGPGADFAPVFRLEDGEFIEQKEYTNEFQSWFRPRLNYIQWKLMKRIYQNIEHPELLADIKYKCSIIE